MKIFKKSKKIAVTFIYQKNQKFDRNKSVLKLNFTSDEKISKSEHK